MKSNNSCHGSLFDKISLASIKRWLFFGMFSVLPWYKPRTLNSVAYDLKCNHRLSPDLFSRMAHMLGYTVEGIRQSHYL